MPKRRALAVIAWFGRNAILVMIALLFVVLGLLIWNIKLYLNQRHTQSRLSGIEIARIVEQRANNKSTVMGCRASISTISIANVLIGTQKSDLLQRAASNRKLAAEETNKKLRAIRLKSATDAEEKARVLHLFPPRTKQECDELAKKLRADLVQKYGERLRQLEQEERKSQKSDT